MQRNFHTVFTKKTQVNTQHGHQTTFVIRNKTYLVYRNKEVGAVYIKNFVYLHDIMGAVYTGTRRLFEIEIFCWL